MQRASGNYNSGNDGCNSYSAYDGDVLAIHQTGQDVQSEPSCGTSSSRAVLQTSFTASKMPIDDAILPSIWLISTNPWFLSLSVNRFEALRSSMMTKIKEWEVFLRRMVKQLLL